MTLFMDPNNARLIRQQILECLRRNADCPGITRVEEPEGELFYNFLVGNRVYVEVRAYSSSKGVEDCYLRIFDGPDAPCALITVSGDCVKFEYRPDDQYEKALAVVATRLEHGFIPLKLHMPYGYVQDGKVIAIWYSRLRGGNVRYAGHVVCIDFALKGYDLPKPLLSRNTHPARYTQSCWDLVRSGQIIELGQRIVRREGSLFFVSSDTSWPHLVFTEEDNKQPYIPANTPYLLRLASDPAGSDLPRTRKLVAAYQQPPNDPPENMSEFFARFM